jgi:two-component system NtrC family sensor kinase
VQQEKMASLGTLAAVVAHEIQNPLNFVNNFSELSNELITELESENDESVRNSILNDVKDNLTKIRTHGKRADAIVKNMLLLSRAENGARETVDINKLCDEAINFCFHAMPSNTPGFNCNIVKDYTGELPLVNMVRTEVSRVILNLLNNAVYALRQKKQEGSDPGFDPQITVSTSQSNGKVIIRIRDNGNGIPEKVMKKIFEPFFTTKPPNEGTGLGLSMSFDIVKAHGGNLIAFNDQGAVFQIELPA